MRRAGYLLTGAWLIGLGACDPPPPEPAAGGPGPAAEGPDPAAGEPAAAPRPGAAATPELPLPEPVRAFDESAAALIAGRDALLERARHLDAEALLAALRQGAPSWVYAMSERLGDAAITGASPDTTGRDRPLFSADFRGGRGPMILVPQTWKPGERRSPLTALTDGELTLSRWYWTQHLMTRKPLSIQPQELGELEIRIRADSPSVLQISWDTTRAPSKSWQAAIALIPDGAMHTYRTDLSRLSPVLGGEGDQTITRLLLRPTTQDPDRRRADFGIAYVRLHRRRASFTEPAARSLLRAGGEQRDGIYASTAPGGGPLSLRYTVDLPEDAAIFRTGMAAFQGGDPVRFQVALSARGRTEILIDHLVAEPDRWEDISADLSAYAGERVEIALTASSVGGNIALWGGPTIYQPREHPTRVVLILEDTERGDHISALGYARRTTPFKDQLFAGGSIFTRAFSQAPKTRPSCASFMSSLPSRATGVTSSQHFLPESFLTLPELLRARGFATASFTQNVNSGPSAGLHQGVDVIRDNGFMGADPTGAYSEETLDWVDRNLDRDFFLYLHLLDPHGSYSPPPSHRGWFEEARAAGGPEIAPDRLDPSWLEGPRTAAARVALYDGEIAYNDELMRSFIEALGRRVPLEDTLLIFLSDHGEHQGEQGLWGHHPPSLKGGIRVPLMIRYDSELPAQGLVHTPAQLLDLAPTVLELVGVDPADLPLAGRSLVPVLRGEADSSWEDRIVLSEEDPIGEGAAPRLWGSLFFRDYHLLYTDSLPGEEGRPALRLYNYIDDPEETRPLGGDALSELLLGRAEPLLAALAERDTAIRETFRGGGDNAIEMDDETLSALRELGYVQ